MRRGRKWIATAIAIAFLWLTAWYWWWPGVATNEAISDEAVVVLESDSVAVQSEAASPPYSIAEPQEQIEDGLEATAVNCIDSAKDNAREDLPDITEADFANAAEQLMDSPDPRHLVAAALLTFDEDDQSLRVARFDKALVANPADPVTLSLVFTECGREGFSDWCERHDIENRLIAADTSNSESWALIADRRLRNDDNDGGLEALERAAVAPDMNSYFVEQLDIVEHGLAATGLGTHGRRFIAAMGVAAARSRPYGAISRRCGEQSPMNERWRSACLANGKKMESQSRTMIGYMLGIGLQRTVYRAIGDEQQLKELDQIINDFSKKIDSAIDIDFEERMTYDDAFVAKYSDYFKNKGELAAWEYRQERLEAWRAERCSVSP